MTMIPSSHVILPRPSSVEPKSGRGNLRRSRVWVARTSACLWIASSMHGRTKSRLLVEGKEDDWWMDACATLLASSIHSVFGQDE